LEKSAKKIVLVEDDVVKIIEARVNGKETGIKDNFR